MEDIHLAIDNFSNVPEQGLFCVCDGHGGPTVVKYLEKHLADVISKNLAVVKDVSTLKWERQVTKELIASFIELDINCAHIKQSGATLACCLVCPTPDKSSKYIFAANVGDTRIVLAKHNEPCERLSIDHHALNKEEQKRILKSGGFILRDRVLGILSVSRSIGDHFFKRYVTARPHTSSFQVEDNHDFLIIACDGVWDVFSDDEAVALIKEGVGSKFPEKDAAKALTDAALARGSTDNITAVIIFL